MVMTMGIEMMEAVKIIYPPIAGPGVYWDIETIAAALRYEKRKIDSMVADPTFPRPIRRGHPRWKSEEVVKWFDSQRETSKAGRPRKAV